MNQELPTVVVAVLTFHREDQIAALVPLLAAQITAAAEVCRAELVVVDNDPAGGAAGPVRTALAAAGDPGRYVHETQPGLAAARNRALTEAIGADALVFIDDDEQPTPGWLTALVRTWQQTGAWAVSGPVRSNFASPPGDWVLGSGIFDRLRDTTGAPRNSAATNNLLLDLAALRGAGLGFDERFAVTGGEDSFLMQSLRRAGGDIAWCDEAEVGETVPANRTTRGWVLRRAMRMGETWARVRVLLAEPGRDRLAMRANCVARGGLRLARHALPTLASRLRRDAHTQGRHETELAGGLGLLRGALGLGYQEYQRPAS